MLFLRRYSIISFLIKHHLGFYAGIPDFSVTPVSTWQPSLDVPEFYHLLIHAYIGK
ncbi:Uncharacterised protein [Yersinia pseudotuberculosis]|uniref:Uncharacterized protein n=2 Tax=Yersinia pseudotuberculosis complex TaxID=1649845 RepID=A0A380Q907_YERPU|nr:Uncharacterised protein [Yersinia pseudotuberculosis]CRG52499.1 Uncharacterised protein [Yersinia wautersii]SUP83052.1 Uncharacterised protein [Yersinia pseudotuberculosis]